MNVATNNYPMFYIYLLSVLSTVACASYRSKPTLTHVEAIRHMKDFLHDVQQQILYAQHMLERIDAEIPSLRIRAPNTATISTNADRKDVAPIAVSGYFSDSFERFFKQTITKSPVDVMKVLQPGMSVAASMDKNGQLTLLQGPIKAEFFKFLLRLFNDPYDDLKSHLTSLYKHMQNRAELCNAELNYIINHANSLVEKEDGEHLSQVIDDFEKFPKGDKTGEQLCEHILEAFLRPFRKKEGTIELNRLYLYASGVIVLQRQGEGGFRKTVASARRNEIPPGLLEELDRADMVLRDLQGTIKESQDLVNNVIEYADTPTNFKKDPLDLESLVLEPSTEYLSEAYILFFQQIASKNQVYVQDVLKHIPSAKKALEQDGKLKWLGKRVTSLLNELITSVLFTRPESLQNTATMLAKSMQNRKRKFVRQFNEMIDVANEIVTKNDGERLLEVVGEFEAYPNVDKSGKVLCKDIMEAFATPFEKVKSSAEFKNFMSSVENIRIDKMIADDYDMTYM